MNENTRRVRNNNDYTLTQLTLMLFTTDKIVTSTNLTTFLVIPICGIIIASKHIVHVLWRNF